MDLNQRTALDKPPCSRMHTVASAGPGMCGSHLVHLPGTFLSLCWQLLWKTNA